MFFIYEKLATVFRVKILIVIRGKEVVGVMKNAAQGVAFALWVHVGAGKAHTLGAETKE